MTTFWRAWGALAPAVSPGEAWRATLGAALAITLTGLLSQWLQPAGSAIWLVAPMGASTVLLLALPSSPLTRPWPVIGGNTLSALIGLAVGPWVPQPHLAAGLAVGLALLAMFALRCLHPPGGALALLTVLTGSHDWAFALDPVLLNSALLVLLAALYNHFTRKPHPRPTPSSEAAVTHFTTADLDAALRHHQQLVDMDREDLQDLLHDAQAHAYERTLGQLRCSEIMSRQMITVRGQETLAQAWQRLQQHNIKALPVVNPSGHVMGIITRSDFMAHWLQADPSLAAASDATPVRQRMSRQVRVASETTRVIDLLPLFSQGGHHHLPIVNNDHVLVGMVTESDVVRALHKALS
jgi:CBS domain-containing membrane protein